MSLNLDDLDKYLIGIGCITLATGIIIIGLSLFVIPPIKVNCIPELRGKKLEQDYVNPNNLEIKLEDLNKNGKYETVMQYKEFGKEAKYLMRWKGENIELKKYEVKGSEIIEK